MKKTFSVLALFDYNSFTGFATVSKNLVSQWQKIFGNDMRMDIVAVNYFGEAYAVSENIRVISAKRTDVAKDDFGRYVFMRSLMDIEYDLIFIMQDLGVIVPVIPHVKKILEDKKKANKKQFKSILYFPVDFALTPNLSVGLEFFDVLATYTEFGRKEVLRLNPALKPKLRVIPHGNNSGDFYPLPESEVADFRKAYFGEENAGKFIVGSLNRNQSRKDIPSTIFGFMEFWENNKNSLLYLHMNPDDPMGWQLRTILKQTPLVEGKDVLFPPEDDYNKGADVAKLNRIYNSLDTFLSTATGEGWGLCLHPDTLITTDKGVFSIPAIQKGDKVLTNDGQYQSVLDTTYRSVESYIEIKCDYGFSSKASHEHPYLVAYKNTPLQGADWVKFEEINIGDYLAIRKPLGNKPLGSEFDLADFVSENKGWVIDKDTIHHKMGYSPKSKEWSISEIGKRYQVSKPIVETGLAILKGQKIRSVKASNLANQLKKDGYTSQNKQVTIKRFIPINDDLLWLIGLYLADGSSGNGKRVEFCLNVTSKKKYANRVAKLAKQFFGVKTVTQRIRGNRLDIRISSSLMAMFFTKICGHHAKNKKVPGAFIGSEKKLMPLVAGYINGDGHVKLENDMISFSTVSPSLAYQVQSILNSNDIFLAISPSQRRGQRIYVGGIPAAHCRKYMDKVGIKGSLARERKRNHTPNFLETDTHFFVRVKSIAEIEQPIYMYDLCVSDSHTFVGNGLVCHNTITEAMAAKKPVIAPMHTSIEEICQAGDRAYMLTTLYPVVAMVDNIIRFQTDIYEIAETIAEVEADLKSNSPKLKNKIINAFAFVNSLSWDKIAKRFADEMKKLV